MGTDLIISNRAEVAAYTGLARTPRGRRFFVIATIDVLAVGLALGALHVGGALLGSGKVPDIIQPVSAAEPVATDTPLVPMPRVAPVQAHFAAMPDAAVMFAPAMDREGVARGFTFADRTTTTSTFTPPSETAANAPAAAPVEPAPAVPTPHLRPVSGLLATAAPLVDAADGSLDRLLMRGVALNPGPVVATTVDAAATAVVRVASAAAPGSATQNVVRTLAAPVQTLHSVGGLLN
jgi:hypothetical protein